MKAKVGLVLIALQLLVMAPIVVLAQSTDQNSQEKWLRYSNWEHRSSMPKSLNNAKEAKVEPEKNTSPLASPLTLPDRPGSQTVEGTQATIPGWAFQQPQQAQRPPEYIVGASSFGSTPSFQANLAQRYWAPGFGGFPLYGSAALPSFGYGIPGQGFGIPGLGYAALGIPGIGIPGLGYGNYGRGSHWGAPAWGNYGGRIPKYSWGGFSGGAYGRYGGYGGLGAFPYGAGFGGGLQPTRLGPQVLQTGPSPASGNYYQPSTGDPSASGNYYAGGAPWQVPVNAPDTPKDYWGPGGSPFK